MTALGIVGFDSGLRAAAIHPRGRWIGGWNFDPIHHHVRAIGDLDGDSRAEFIVTGDWGLGVLKHEGAGFAQMLGAPRGTRLGGWRYDDPAAQGRDKIVDVGDFTGSGRNEILIWSRSGLAALALDGGSMRSRRMHSNGVRLGGWVISTIDNRYWGRGRFGTGSHDVMVVSSPWGLGLISLQRGRHIFMAPNGTRFGSWTLQTAVDEFLLIGDFDGDGEEELFVSSRSGVAVLKLVDGALTAIAHHRLAESLGGYILDDPDDFTTAGRFRTGAADQILVKDHRGLHILALDAGRLVRRAFAENGVRIDGWIISTSDNFVVAAGDVTGDGQIDFLIRSPWGIGVITAVDTFRCRSLHPYGERLGDWPLESGDIICGSGRFTGGARSELLIKKPFLNPAAPVASIRRFANWHGNNVRDLPTVQPRNLPELVLAVRGLSERRQRVAVMGSGWSFTDCAVDGGAHTLIDTSALNATLTDLVPEFIPDHDGGGRSFVHVEAGIKLYELNCRLDAQGLAMATMGGSRGQSLAGVVSTGVHGSDISLPPIADAVRAIHLVGPGGQQYWIEPVPGRLGRPGFADRARARGVLGASVRTVFDEQWFYSVLVSFGCAGVIYSIVLECRPAFRLQSTTVAETWAAAQERIRNLDFPDRRPRFLEVNVNPTDASCRATFRAETTAPERDPPVRRSLAIGEIAAAAGLLGPGALGAFLGAIGDYIGRTAAEIAGLFAIPVAGPVLAAQKTAEALRPVEDAHRLLVELGLAAVDPHNPRRVADVLPTAINLIWAVGGFIPSGRLIVDRLQSEITAEQRPVQSFIGKSYRVMTGQPDCPADGVQVHDATDRLVESYDYAVPVNRAIDFVNRLMGAVQEQRAGRDATVVNLNLRFTGRTRAILGMQKFDPSCHVEIYTFRGLRGNDSFKRRMARIVDEFNAVPHWGQFHLPEEARVYEEMRAMPIWRSVMRQIAGGNEMFWTNFARGRGLLP